MTNKSYKFQNKRSYIKCGSILPIILIVILFSFNNSWAQEQNDQIRVTAIEANVRSGAGTDSPVILRVSEGTVFTVIGRDGNWYQVQLSIEYGTQEDYGFIHNSIVEPVDVILSVINTNRTKDESGTTQNASSQNYQVQNPAYKDPDKALLYGILVPGGGHFYSDDKKMGGILLGAAILAPVIGTIIATNNVESAVNTGNYGSTNTPIFLGIAVSLGAWVYSFIDAPKAAQRINIKNGLAWNNRIQVSPDLLITNNDHFGYGVSMRIKI